MKTTVALVSLNNNVYVLDSLAARRFQKTGQWYTAQQWRQTGQDMQSIFTTSPSTR